MTRFLTRAALAASLATGATATAHAADWSDFQAAFPVFPCSDGWAACEVEGIGRITPEPLAARRGVPMAADLRLDWFALEPTATFSPYTTLSVYDGPPHQVAAPRVIKVVQTPAIPERIERPRAGERRAVLPPVVQPKIPEEIRAPELETTLQTVPRCDDLAALQSHAGLGKLGKEQVTCLVARLDSQAETQTTLDKISRLLIADAWFKGDRASWDKRVRFHVEHIDRSDPELVLSYARHLSRTRGHEEGVIRWVDVASENRHLWVSNYVTKVTELHKLKTRAGNQLWQDAEAAHTAAPTAQTRAAADQARSRVKVYAREWLDYARSAGTDPTLAEQVCVSAAGTHTYCDG